MAQTPITFFSKYAGYQIIMVHDSKMIVGDEVVKKPHRILKFSHGQLTTTEPAVIAFLKSRSNYGRDFYASDDAEVQPAVKAAVAPADVEAPVVAKPLRTKKGEKARVDRKPTTAADVDVEAGVAPVETDED